jgi:hypothetical protein
VRAAWAAVRAVARVAAARVAVWVAVRAKGARLVATREMVAKVAEGWAAVWARAEVEREEEELGCIDHMSTCSGSTCRLHTRHSRARARAQKHSK